LSPDQVDEDLREAFGGITFRDGSDVSWRHDGTSWWRWANGDWAVELPPPRLVLDRVELEVDPSELIHSDAVEEEWTQPEEVVFTPTHVVPPDGVSAWSTPDPTAQPVTTIDGLLDVELVERRDDGWAHVLCGNGWSAWVDGELLLPAALIEPQDPI
jgi:hypothetical protein